MCESHGISLTLRAFNPPPALSAGNLIAKLSEPIAGAPTPRAFGQGPGSRCSLRRYNAVMQTEPS